MSWLGGLFKEKEEARDPNPSCSFCAKSQQEVQKLIAGPKVYICDECIRLCNESRLPEVPVQALSCSFCGKKQEEVKKLFSGPAASVCWECVDLCNDVLAEEIGREKPR